jgi:vancomycin resistance protein YoaR
MIQQLRNILGLVLVTCLGFFCGVLAYGGMSGGRIPDNTWIGELYVGGRTPSEALELLGWLHESLPRREIVLSAAGADLRVTGADLGIGVDMEEAERLIDRIVRSQTLLGRAIDSFRAAPADAHVPVPITYSEPAVEALYKRLADAIDKPPVNARYDVALGRFVKERPGSLVDRDALVATILEGFELDRPGAVQVPVISVSPHVTLELLSRLGIAECISWFKTEFDSRDLPRSSNIARAAGLIDGAVIMPSEEFSFNDRVGPRTREAGFEEAREIVDSDYVIGIGGGVCQVSSTLYNAAILAGFETVERRPHSRVSGYIQAGRDATVYYPTIDLRFRNCLETPVMLSLQIEGNTLYAAVVGNPSGMRRIEITTRTVSTLTPKTDHILDATLPSGKEIVEQEPEAGLIVETWRTVYSRDGVQTSQEILSRDVYLPVNRILRVGTGT